MCAIAARCPAQTSRHRTTTATTSSSPARVHALLWSEVGKAFTRSCRQDFIRLKDASTPLRRCMLICQPVHVIHQLFWLNEIMKNKESVWTGELWHDHMLTIPVVRTWPKPDVVPWILVKWALYWFTYNAWSSCIWIVQCSVPIHVNTNKVCLRYTVLQPTTSWSIIAGILVQNEFNWLQRHHKKAFWWQTVGWSWT